MPTGGEAGSAYLFLGLYMVVVDDATLEGRDMGGEGMVVVGRKEERPQQWREDRRRVKHIGHRLWAPAARASTLTHSVGSSPSLRINRHRLPAASLASSLPAIIAPSPACTRPGRTAHCLGRRPACRHRLAGHARPATRLTLFHRRSRIDGVKAPIPYYSSLY